MKLGGQDRRILDNFLHTWDHANAYNLDCEDAITRETSKDICRAFYKRKAVFELRHIHVAAGGKAPIRPDALENLVEEPAELEEFRHHAKHLPACVSGLLGGLEGLQAAAKRVPPEVN